MLTITHTHEAGTLIEGTAKGDGTAAILKSAGWRWGRSIGAWYIPGSRDHLPKRHVIGRTVAALEGAGYVLAPLQLDTAARSTAEVEADKIARQAARVAALDTKAERKAADADTAWARHEHDVDRLPPGGEPIKVGHHSEGRHRAAIARAERSIRAAIVARDGAAAAADRARAAAETTSRRYRPVTVANRIEKLAADIRRCERRITAPVYDTEIGYRHATQAEQDARAVRLGPALDEMRDQLRFWQQVRAEQIASGKATSYGPRNVAKGDAVKVRGHWYRVVRVNAKTVAVETGHSWTDRTPWHEVQDHRAAASANAVL